MVHTTLEVSSLEELRSAFVDWLTKQAARDRNYGQVVCKLKKDQKQQHNFATALDNAAQVWKDVVIISVEK